MEKLTGHKVDCFLNDYTMYHLYLGRHHLSLSMIFGRMVINTVQLCIDSLMMFIYDIIFYFYDIKKRTRLTPKTTTANCHIVNEKVTRILSFVWGHNDFVNHYSWRNKNMSLSIENQLLKPFTVNITKYWRFVL